MATPSVKIDEHQIFLHTDKIVCRLDEFPELLQALCDGDLLTGRLFWAQLFDFDAMRLRSRPEEKRNDNQDKRQSRPCQHDAE